MNDLGKVRIIKNFDMPQLGRQRTLRIYLPPLYDTSKRRYGVLYMHDAQNLFNVKDSAFGTIWDVKNSLDQRHQTMPDKDIIVVGIDNGERYRYAEYSPWKSNVGAYYLPHALETGIPGGEGFEYIDFIVNTLKPYIDTHFRTKPDRENTSIAGSSMGGLISLCAGISHQQIFSKIAAFSSAIYFAEDEVIKLIERMGQKADMRIYMDVGTAETSNPSIPDFPKVYVDCSQHTYDALIQQGFNPNHLIFKIFEGDIHNESCWAKRFPDMLSWLYDSALD